MFVVMSLLSFATRDSIVAAFPPFVRLGRTVELDEIVLPKLELLPLLKVLLWPRHE